MPAVEIEKLSVRYDDEELLTFPPLYVKTTPVLIVRVPDSDLDLLP